MTTLQEKMTKLRRADVFRITLINEHEANSVLPEEHLAYAIIEQAINDYSWLKSKGIERDFLKGDEYNVSEIEGFFSSEWCDGLLGIIGSGLCGQRIRKQTLSIVSEVIF